MTQASISLPNKIKLDQSIYLLFSQHLLFIFLAPSFWLLLLFFSVWNPWSCISAFPGSNLQLSRKELPSKDLSGPPCFLPLWAEEKMTHQLTGGWAACSVGLEEPVRTNEWCGKSRCPREYSLVALTS